MWPPEGAIAVDVTDGYQRLAERGYQYGPAFQGLTALWRRGDEFFAEVTLPQAAGGVTGFGVHPVLLDAALHAAAVTQARRRCGTAVLVAGRVAARGGSVGGAGADRAVGSVGGVGRTGRRAGLAGADGDVDGCAPDFAAAVDGGDIRRHRRIGFSSWPGRRHRPRRTPRRRRTRCSNPPRLPAIRSPRATNGCTPHWRRCSPGWPNTSRVSWWCQPAARWGCRARTSPIWPVRPCGGWCGRRRPSIRAASCWWIPMCR